MQAVNGATTGASAFTLSGGSVSAGAYTYFLARGGASSGTGNNWYPRNTIPPRAYTGSHTNSYTHADSYTGASPDPDACACTAHYVG